MVAKNAGFVDVSEKTVLCSLAIYDPSKKCPLNVQVLINFDGHFIIATKNWVCYLIW